MSQSGDDDTEAQIDLSESEKQLLVSLGFHTLDLGNDELRELIQQFALTRQRIEAIEKKALRKIKNSDERDKDI